MKKSFNLLVAILLLFVTKSFSQRPNYNIRNYIGIQGGVTQFDILTDNFETEAQTGWTAGLTAMVNVEHKWYDFSYGIRFSDNNVNISGRSSLLATKSEMLKYKLSAAQLMVLMHAKVIGEHLMIDFGPAIQANGKLELQDKTKEDYIIDNNEAALSALDIEDISKFNINGAIGATAGFKHFRIRAQYQYGFTNMLNKLNDLEIEGNKFKGNQSQLLLTALVLF